ncbi:hypothetical protein GJ496_005331 [Pomphorhynchus laevis]|nr:hypothetical protein GJ496_005331 [Pomphorhynchus laevis]
MICSSIQARKWSHSTPYIFVLINHVVGMGNCIHMIKYSRRYGGFNFMIQYIILTVFFAIPVIFLEMLIGHSFHKSYIKTWDKLSSTLKGVGYATILLNVYYELYFIAQSIKFAYIFFDSLTYPNVWDKLPKISSKSSNNGSQMHEILKLTVSNNCKGGFRFDYLPFLIIMMTACFAHIHSGAKTINQWAYAYLIIIFTSAFVVLNKAASITSAFEGYDLLFRPQWCNLKNLDSWYNAASSAMHSASIGSGIYIAITSYAGENVTDLKFTTVVIVIFDFVLSLIISILLSFTFGIHAVAKINSTTFYGDSHMFKIVSYTINNLSHGRFFLITYYIMILLLLSSTMFLTMEGIYSALSEQIKYLRSSPANGRLITVLVMGVLSLPFILCNGDIIADFIDIPNHHNVVVPLVITLEALAVTYSYGLKSFIKKVNTEDNEFPGLFFEICWTLVVPVISISYFIYTISNVKFFGDLNDRVTLIHMITNIFMFLPVPLYLIYSCLARFIDREAISRKLKIHI